MSSVKKRLLIADPDKHLTDLLKKAPAAEHFTIEIVHTATACLEKLNSFSPDFVYLELYLPEMHGIEILRRIREQPKLKGIGVIIGTCYPIVQSYHAALIEGVNYYLNKPFSPDLFFSLVERFFIGELKPDPFSFQKSHETERKPFLPEGHLPQHYIKFWGTRGSNPVSGSDYIRFGGNTCCTEVRYGDDFFIIDAGTGLRRLGEKSRFPKGKTINILFTHTHWDHVTGFPFFAPLYEAGHHICLWVPVGFEKIPADFLKDILAYAYFPVRLDDIKAHIEFKELRDHQTVKIGDIEIQTHYAFHPCSTFCFKIRTPEQVIGYATDNEILLGFLGNPKEITKEHPMIAPYLSMIEFFKDCDLLIHEAQYFQDEYQHKIGWGHSSIANAGLLVKLTQCKEWVVIHHDPSHTDDILHKKIQMHFDIMKECKIDTTLRFAYDGFVIPI